MRCKQADPEDPTEVRFVFECDGTRYCFARKLTRRKSKKADAAVSYNEDYSCTREENGIWVPLLDNAKKKSMNEKAGELIGLDLNQFRQVIILPQGRFETLLTSGSAEKESILADLFHTNKWQQAVDKMVEELKTRKDEIERETQRINDGLNRLQIASVGELPEAVRAAEERMDTVLRANRRTI
jgi:DNA repair exonuclease SbcCD ATPase subunit